MSSQPSNSYDSPYDDEIERIVLGSVLISPDIFLTLSAFLRADDFFVVRHRYIWAAMQRLTDRAEIIERQTLRRELEAYNQFLDIGGELYLSDLINSAPSALYAEHYARLIERDATRRRLLEASDKIRQIARDKQKSVEEALSESESEIFAISERRSQRDIISIRQAAEDYFNTLDAILNNNGRPQGLPSGFKKLDALLGGLQRSDLLVFAGRPGMGKTSFMLSLALNAAIQFDARILVFSLEMGVEQLVQRLISMETGITMQNLRTGQIQPHEQRRLVEALGRLGMQNIFIDDSPSLTPIQMRTKCQRVKYEYGLDLVILDYLQLMHAPGYEGNRVQEISYISRQLKELAREINVPLMSAAQLSRAVEQRADKRPQLSDLRESGSIEQDADIVMFLYRDIVYNEATENPNQADVIVAKHRNGPTDTIPLYFDASSTRFQDGSRQNIDLNTTF